MQKKDEGCKMKKYRIFLILVCTSFFAAAFSIIGCKDLLPDEEPPGKVTDFVATAGDGQITLSWVNPQDADFAGVIVVFSIDETPESVEAGEKIYEGTNTSYTHRDITTGTVYYYTVFAFDEGGNYAAGVSGAATIIGELSWERTIDFAAGTDSFYGVAIDSQENVIAVGYYDPDPDTTTMGTTSYIVKFSDAGTILWDDEIEVGAVGGEKASSDERLYDVAVDADDNVYVVGQVSGTFTSYALGSYHSAFLIRKYDADGNLLWEDIWQESSNSPWNTAYGLDIDTTGNAYAGGLAFGSWSTLGAWAIRKYSPEGDSLFSPAIIYDPVRNIADLNELCREVKIDSEGAIIGSGRVGVSYPDATTYDYNWHVRKYDAAGNTVWSSTYANPANLNDRAFSVDIDSADQVFVAGYTNKGTLNSGDGANYDWLVKKYSKDGDGGEGEVLWTYQYETAADSSEGCYALAADTDNHVLVCGTKIVSDNEKYIRVIKLANVDGAELGEYLYSAPNGCAPWAVSIRGNGIAVAGTVNNGNDSDMFVMYLEK